MEIRIRESARDDLRNAWTFYDQNRAGLGDYFLDCVQADVSSLLLFAGIHEVSEDYHRMLVKRFPFAIYYLIEGEFIDIYAILDCRRESEWIVERLNDVRKQR
jgi:plasmid stabilization system protein ParE